MEVMEEMENKALSVSELNAHIKLLMDRDRVLSSVCVWGELSNYKVYPSGHHYFTLKDAGGSLKCVMFRSAAARLRFRPESGMGVTALGRVSVYPRDGAYQLFVSELHVRGIGDLQLAFEQLKEKLAQEGLFLPAHKKAIPRFPHKIAVITSGAGAAVRDIIRVSGRRWPMAKLLIMPVRVQGTEAPPEIVGAIRYANRYRVADLIITGRGGGSMEDLWAFNDERVARAIYESELPVISAVGHEPDVTIADFVADLRAATPSNGAELALPDQAELYEALRVLDIRAGQALRKRLDANRKHLEQLASRRVLRSPEAYIDQKRMETDRARMALLSAGENTLSPLRRKYSALAGSLDALSPLKVLSRGYAVAMSGSGTALRAADEVSVGDSIRVRLSRGQLGCVVQDIEQNTE